MSRYCFKDVVKYTAILSYFFTFHECYFSRVRHPSHPGLGDGSLTCHMTQLERTDWQRSANLINIMIEYDNNITVRSIFMWSNPMNVLLFTVTTLERLHTDLMTNYKKVRPVTNWADTVDVKVFFSLVQVKSLVSKTNLLFSAIGCNGLLICYVFLTNHILYKYCIYATGV